MAREWRLISGVSQTARVLKKSGAPATAEAVTGASASEHRQFHASRLNIVVLRSTGDPRSADHIQQVVQGPAGPVRQQPPVRPRRSREDRGEVRPERSMRCRCRIPLRRNGIPDGDCAEGPTCGRVRLAPVRTGPATQLIACGLLGRTPLEDHVVSHRTAHCLPRRSDLGNLPDGALAV